MRVLKARFKTKEEFSEAYTDEFSIGGIFCATTEPLAEKEQVVVEIYFPQLPNKMMVSGKVASWRSAIPRLRVRAGAQIAFNSEEKAKVDFIKEVAAGKREDAIKRKHRRLPIEMPVKWRPANSPDLRKAVLREISIGGAQIITDEKLQTGDDLIVELTAPGGSRAIPIACKVTYHIPLGGFGLQFIYRDGGGSRRLREVVRRLIEET